MKRIAPPHDSSGNVEGDFKRPHFVEAQISSEMSDLQSAIDMKDVNNAGPPGPELGICLLFPCLTCF